MPKRKHTQTKRLITATKKAKRLHVHREEQKLAKERQKRARAKQAASRRTAHVPYDNGDAILLVGEGDFSFARALAQLLPDADVVATSLDTRQQVIVKYGSEVLDEVQAIDRVVLLHGVDCAQLGAHVAQYAPFDKIVFNFPHCGAGEKDEATNVRMHQQLLASFFAASKPLLRESGSEVHLTLKRGKPYSLWRAHDVAALCGLALRKAVQFAAARFEGYVHRATRTGDAVSELDGATTSIFVQKEEVEAEQERRKKAKRRASVTKK